jgi:ABC-type transport system involved in multi-copper enzyme maturation permease subunit
MDGIRSLLTENPMLVEAKRFMMRFAGFGRGALNSAVLILAIISYVLLMLLVLSIPSFGAPIVIFIQMVVYCFMLPLMLQGSIAGEREKGTWDTLLASPVTKGQIVIGKFWSAFVAILVVAGLLLLPLLYTNYAAAHDPFRTSGYGISDTDQSLSLWTLFYGEMLALTFGFCLASWCLLVSARSKRAFSAQGLIVGSMLVGLVLWPMLISSIGLESGGMFALTNFLHPFIVGAEFLTPISQDETRAAARDLMNGWMTVGLYIVLTAVFLVWTERTLRFVESDVRFMPRGQHASDK